MNFFEVRDGELYCEDVPLARIAETVGTPVYVYSAATLERHYNVFQTAFAHRRALIAFAVKANSNLSVLKTLARLGAGADTVSEGEVLRALAAGVPPERIVFSGVGKTDHELAFAIDAGVSEINVESEPELDRLAQLAAAKGARPAITIRVNPDIAAGGHDKIATGKSDNKFGVSFSEAERLYAKAAASPSLHPIGVACHIGSQITDLAPMRAAFAKMRGLVQTLRERGLHVERLDLGGGLGAPYFDQPAPPAPAEFAKAVEEALDGLQIDLVFEPGRVIAANAGVLLSQVIHVHERPNENGQAGKRFLVVDAAMNDLVRPAMYDAFHDLRPVKAPHPGANLSAMDVVGPVCETGDFFARDRMLAPVQPGDSIALLDAGAYGMAQSSNYNTRMRAAEVLVTGSKARLIRRRETIADLLAPELRL